MNLDLRRSFIWNWYGLKCVVLLAWILSNFGLLFLVHKTLLKSLKILNCFASKGFLNLGLFSFLIKILVCLKNWRFWSRLLQTLYITPSLLSLCIVLSYPELHSSCKLTLGPLLLNSYLFDLLVFFLLKKLILYRIHGLVYRGHKLSHLDALLDSENLKKLARLSVGVKGVL